MLHITPSNHYLLGAKYTLGNVEQPLSLPFYLRSPRLSPVGLRPELPPDAQN